jgi:hypothetical protein
MVNSFKFDVNQTFLMDEEDSRRRFVFNYDSHSKEAAIGFRHVCHGTFLFLLWF